MAISAGTYLGQYEVLSHIGSGGMGEVYRARDSKLNREVAIKVLPEQFVRDRERIARFRREAQGLASLNQSNIAAIHSFEETGSARFLVMEYVPGDTLRERTKPGPVPVEEALDICKQVASALEVTHEKTIALCTSNPRTSRSHPKARPRSLISALPKSLSRSRLPIPRTHRR